MIRAMLWKEWREQRSIALAILAFGLAALAITAEFADARSGGTAWTDAGPRELMAISLAYLAGAVCGGMLFADEKEVGTIEFLDSMPSRRRSLWAGKIAFGLLLTIGQGVILAGIAVVVGCTDERVSPLAYMVVVVLVGLLSFAWGTCGGALAKSTLGAVFQGSLASIVAGTVLSIPFVMVFGPREFGKPFGPVLLLYFSVWLGVGLLASAAVFTAVDRDRVARAVAGPAVLKRRGSRGPGWRAIFWLSARQAVYLSLGAFGASAVLGAVMLAPDVIPIFIWPGATLVLGVLAGVTALGEEQTRGIARFWAERRLPLGKLWLVKVTFHLSLAIVAGLLIFLPLFAAAPNLPFRSRLLAALRPELWTFLGLGLVYGFVFGHLCGMLFRKTVVAGLVGTITAITVVGLLLPGVIGGGARSWQVWAPALVLLVTARLIVYPWATERVLTRGPVLRAIGGAMLAAAFVAGGIVYRVHEIPLAADSLADAGFEQSLPAYEVNEAGRDARSAAAQFRKSSQDAKADYPPAQPPAQSGSRGQLTLTLESFDPLDRAARLGWVDDVQRLDKWLNRVFEGDWPRTLTGLLAKPVGVFDDPRDLDYFQNMEATRDLREMCAAIRARGMQRIAGGDPDAYPHLLIGGLALVRTARSRTGEYTTSMALQCETILLAGLNEWLPKLDGRPDLLRPLLAELERHEREMPVGADDTFWAEQIILRNTLDRIGIWLPRDLGPRDPNSSGGKADAEAELVAFAWNVPWERARRERLLRLQTNRELTVNRRWLSALHQPAKWRNQRVAITNQREKRGLVERRFAQLKVALRLFQLEHNEPASTLEQLVPTYVAKIPEDPYSDRAMRYRLSKGETLASLGSIVAQPLSRADWLALAVATSAAYPNGAINLAGIMGGAVARANPRPGLGTMSMVAGAGAAPSPSLGMYLSVGPGNGVLWSVGADLKDDGGMRPAAELTDAGPGQDWIVIVPRVR